MERRTVMTSSPAVGIAAALVLLAGCAPQSADPPTGPPGTPPVPQAPPSPAPTLDARTLADLTGGRAPRIGYVADGTWHGPDGSRVGLRERHGISSVTAYAGGFLVADTRWFEGTLGLARLGPGGRLGQEWTSAGGAVAGSGGRAAWTSFVPPESGEVGVPALLHRAGPDGTVTTQPWDGPLPFSVAGFSRDRVVVGGSFVGPVRAIAPDGRSTRVPHLVVARATSGSRVAGTLDADGSRSGIVDLATGRLLWRGPTWLGAFNPAGTSILGEHRGRWVVLDAADGTVREELAVPPRTRLSDVAWEDDRTVLGVAVSRGRTAVLRFGPGGTVERATPVAPEADPLRPRYVLTTRR